MSKVIAWIGVLDHQEWTPLISEIREAKHCLQSFDSALEFSSSSDREPSMICVANRWPGEHSWQEVQDLETQFPQARLVCLLGAWCNGQRRLVPALAALENYYVQELFSPGAMQRLLVGNDGVGGKSSNPLCLAIYAQSRSYRQALAEVLTPRYRCCVETSIESATTVHGVDVVVWEVPGQSNSTEEPRRFRDAWLAELDSIKRRHPNASVLALVTYPRRFEYQEFLKAGVSVLSQPFEIDALYRQIQSLCEINSGRALRLSA